MHGLINRSIQCFLRDTYGAPVWTAVAREAGLGFDSFEPMLSYDAALTEAVIAAAVQLLGRPRDTVLEDLGIYLVSHPNGQALRRLLRFGGVTFADFLHSLEDLPGRARLALSDMDLPLLELTDHSGTDYCIRCHATLPGTGHVLAGILRAMADDYGTLCLVDHRGLQGGAEVIGVTLAAAAFTAARPFDLSLRERHR